MKSNLCFLGALLPAFLSVVAAGCNSDNAYCFACDSSDSGSESGSGGTGGDSGTDTGTEGGMFAGYGGGDASSCTNTTTDPNNCGACGNKCVVSNAYPQCKDSFCIIDKCATGYFDIDGKSTNGCEYYCIPLQDKSGKAVTEEVVCDGKDDNCNGQVDETFDTNTSPQNCGKCGTVCEIPGAKTKCTAGKCAFDSCLPNYQDKNKDISDGCECNSMGVELCNNLDDDCDSEVDEGFDLTSDNANCGACNNLCGDIFPNGKTTCIKSTCQFDGCLPGFFDFDGVQLNGCEYACKPTVPPTEVCDGKDNDCDGSVDNGALPGVGTACGSAVGACKQGTNQCLAGVIACKNAVGPTVEVCDDADNNCDGTKDEGCPTVGKTDLRLDTGATLNQYPASQLNVASDGKNVFAAFTEYRGQGDIHFVSSTDGGATWGADIPAVATASGEIEPYVFASPTKAYLAFERFSGAIRQIFVSSAASPYTAFSAGTRADTSAATVDTFYVRGCVAQAGTLDTVVVVWESLNDASRDVYLRVSKDSAATWTGAPLRVNATAGAADTPAIATDGKRKVYIAWRDSRNGKAEIFGDVYDTATSKLAGNKPLSSGNASKPPVIAADANGNVHVVWTDLRGAKKAIRANSSTDSGTTFKADGVLINTDSTVADADSPTIVAKNGRVAIAWEDTRSGLPDIRVNTSANAGATWKASCARADGGTAGTFASRRPNIAFGSGDLVFVTWEENRLAGKLGDIYANHSSDFAVTFQPKDLRIDVGGTAPASAPSPAGQADSFTPFVFAPNAGKRAAVVWIDGRSATGTNVANANAYGNSFLLP